MSVHVSVILIPKPGKAAEIVALHSPFAEWVKANEPGTLSYTLYKEAGGENLILTETFKDEASAKAHTESEEYKKFIAKGESLESELLAEKPIVRMLELVGGFSSK